ncbi:MAG TPA: chorismate synthase [Thermodesulfovibrionales bacterium]|nr:chorismate synthase [Thermodesulfovibrionales bacterium]
MVYFYERMATLRYLTAGESHGKALIGILEGIPSGLSLSAEDINRDLGRRQMGYGRGGRMKIESDHAEILSGVRWGKTIGSPITLLIENKDYRNWLKGMSPYAEDDGSIPAVTRPRPGHADLTGAIKYYHHDMRNVLERSSARETAVRVALGAVAKKFLQAFHITIGSFVIQIGTIRVKGLRDKGVKGSSESSRTLESIFKKAEKSPVRCPDEQAAKKMTTLIDRIMKSGDSLGGVFEVFATGVPAGLGSYIQWDRRLDGRLAQALMSIQAIKGVEAGLGFEMSKRSGSEVMDEIFYSHHYGYYRKTNNAGGMEAGMTDGMPIILRAAMKPIPTLRRPLRSIDITTKKPVEAAYERSDICAVPAAGVIGEAMVALTITEAFLEKFGGDSMKEIQQHYDSYVRHIKEF